jgi:hypothetical protein
MNRFLLGFALTTLAAFGDQTYKAEVSGPLPESAAAVKSALQPEGVKIVDGSGKVFCELWLRAALPADAKSTEQNITLPEVPHGALMGVISFPADATDRRGQVIKKGVYTLRYSQFPITGDHQGVAPQRDFLVLGQIATDKDPNATPDFKTLMEAARVASGITHPNILSMWKSDQFQPGLVKEGEHDWVLQRKVGNLPVCIILVGRAEG